MGCRSCFLSPRTFAIWIGFIMFAQIFAGAYTKSVLTTVERRFNLSSKIIAVMATGGQIGNLTVMLFVSYFGQRHHRPRLIAIGCLTMTFGYLLTALPQFVGDRYHFDDISLNTTLKNGEDVIICSGDSNKTNVNCMDETQKDASSNLYILIMFGIMTSGLGSSAIQPLGFSFVDDHATEHNSAVYVGIINSIGLIGPMMGYMLGSVLLKMWVDVGWVDTDTITIQPRHPSWVGAWWMGFLFAAVIMTLFSFPLWFYPNIMEKEKDSKDEDADSPTHTEENTKDPEFKTTYRKNVVLKELGGFWNAFKKLAKNKRFVLIVCIWAVEWFKLSSVSTFVVKYLEVAFGKSASQSSFLIGAANLPFLVLGTILGSLIVKKWRLTFTGTLRLVFVAFILTMLCFVGFMMIGCGPIDVAGLTIRYPTSETESLEHTLATECNAACSCDENVYAPVCGPGQITYASPCFAGCSGFVQEDGSIKNYTLCSCVASDPGEQIVTIGRCYSSKCENLAVVVIALKAFSNFVSGIAATPLFVLLMRTLSSEEKAFGIGMAFFTCRLIGWIPAPILVGYAIDATCLLWTEPSCSSHAYCRLFDNDAYRLSYGGILLGVKTLSTCILICLYRLVRREEAETQRPKTIKNVDNHEEADQKLIIANHEEKDTDKNSETII